MSSNKKKREIKGLTRNQIAWRAAQDVTDGSYVNLGIGMPTLIADYVNPEKEIIYHSENGLLGMGPAPSSQNEDPDLINAGKLYVTLKAGGAYFDTSTSFCMMRGGHLTSVFMGAFQVSESGDLANWSTDDGILIPSVGGSMDLAIGTKDVRILMNHVTNEGKARIVRECTYPLTAKSVVSRIYTDLAIIDVTERGLMVCEIVDGLDFDELQGLTDATLSLANNWSILKIPEI